MISSVTFRGTTPIQDAKEEEKKGFSASTIEEKTDEFTRSVDAAADGVKKTTESVTAAIATITGAITMIGNGIKKIGAELAKMVPNCIKNYFAPAIETIGNDGEKILTRQLNKTRAVGWAAGTAIVTALAIGISYIAKKVKANNEAKATEIAKNVSTPETVQEQAQTDNIEE